MSKIKYDRFQPCEHKGCLSHITHPCEGCGRIGGDGVIYYNESSPTIAQQSLSGSADSLPKCSHMDIDRKTDDNNEPYYLCKKCGKIM
jgi:hypothetical protein